MAADLPSRGLTFEEREALRHAIDAARRGERESPVAGRTRRQLGADELAVLRLLAGKEIGAARETGVFAVERQRRTILFKLGARNGAQAVAIAFRARLLE